MRSKSFNNLKRTKDREANKKKNHCERTNWIKKKNPKTKVLWFVELFWNEWICVCFAALKLWKLAIEEPTPQSTSWTKFGFSLHFFSSLSLSLCLSFGILYDLNGCAVNMAEHEQRQSMVMFLSFCLCVVSPRFIALFDELVEVHGFIQCRRNIQHNHLKFKKKKKCSPVSWSFSVARLHKTNTRTHHHFELESWTEFSLYISEWHGIVHVSVIIFHLALFHFFFLSMRVATHFWH